MKRWKVTIIAKSSMSRRSPDDWDTDGTLNVARGVTKVSKPEKAKDLAPSVDAPRTTIDDAANAKGKIGTQPPQSIMMQKQKRHLQQRHNKKALALLERHETKRTQAEEARLLAASLLQDGSHDRGCLQAETDMERTTAVTQVQLQRHFLADDDTAKAQIYDLQLGPHYAPYRLHYDRSGRHSLMVGQGGHVAVMDCLQRTLVSEIHLQRGNSAERIRDATFLHNHTLYAAAQQNHVYIYDGTSGAEVHCLTEHGDPFCLSYLPHHWLLASIGRMGYLKYTDVSTGALVSTHRTKLGQPTAMRYNPANAVIHAGHTNGTVTLWSPAQSTYLAKMKCCKGSTAITDLAIDLSGHTMVTSGIDRQIRVWDLRMYRERHAYYCSAGVPVSLDLSQRGLLAIGHAGHVTIWDSAALSEKATSPYMHHRLGPAGGNAARAPVQTVRFRPFEDVCGIGHAGGVSSIVVPGSGEPALDTSEYHTNPMEDTKQRRETEVRSLLDKLAPDMICLEDGSTTVGGMEEYDPAVRLERLREVQEKAANDATKKKVKGKKRGRSKIQTKLRTKQQNVIDHKLLRLREAAEAEKLKKEIEKEHGSSSRRDSTRSGEGSSGASYSVKDTAPSALKRFFA
jgi:U3 small nucleolar RNA-associated protein 7